MKAISTANFRMFNQIKKGKMKFKGMVRYIVITCALAFATGAQAQHYPAGAEGIKGGSLPPPGIYLRDYNFFYTGDLPTVNMTVTDPGGEIDHFSRRVSVFAYVQAPRLIWITDKKIFGADYGMDVIVPFGYSEVSMRQKMISEFPGGRIVSSQDKIIKDAFGLHDIQVEPLLLSWHKKQFDFAVGYAIWAPTGCFNKNDMVNLGTGFWTHMFTLGGVWYLDTEKTIALSLLDRYEINQEQDQTHVTLGNRNTLEWGFSKSVTQHIDLGIIGYYQQQTTGDCGHGASSELAHVVGVGPEVSVFWQKIGIFTSLRYVYEAEAKDLPQGHLVSLTVTRRF